MNIRTHPDGPRLTYVFGPNFMSVNLYWDGHLTTPTPLTWDQDLFIDEMGATIELLKDTPYRRERWS